MLNPAIYRTIFNLDKDRKDLPAGNRAVPYPGVSSGGDDEKLPPGPDIKPYMPIPKPPKSRPQEPVPGVELTAEEEIDYNAPGDTAAAETINVTQAAPDGLTPKAKGVKMDEKFRASRQSQPAGETMEEGYYKKSSSPTTSKDSRAAEERNAFFEDRPSVGIEPQLDRAAMEAKIQNQAQAALKATPGLAEAPKGMRPGTPKQLRRADEDLKYNEKLQASLPHANPVTRTEKAENRKAELKYKAENPRNEDHGIKGFIKETLQNFLFGLSKAQGVPGISMTQALMLGGVGAGGGMLNRGWNEQRAAEDQLGGAQKDLDSAVDQDRTDRTLGIQETAAQQRERGLQRQEDRDAADDIYRNRALGVRETTDQNRLALQEARDLAAIAHRKEQTAASKKRLEQADERLRQGERKLKQYDQKNGTSTGGGAQGKPLPAQNAKKTLQVAQASLQAAIANGASPQDIATAKQRIEDFKKLNGLK